MRKYNKNEIVDIIKPFSRYTHDTLSLLIMNGVHIRLKDGIFFLHTQGNSLGHSGAASIDIDILTVKLLMKSAGYKIENWSADSMDFEYLESIIEEKEEYFIEQLNSWLEGNTELKEKLSSINDILNRPAYLRIKEYTDCIPLTPTMIDISYLMTAEKFLNEIKNIIGNKNNE